MEYEESNFPMGDLVSLGLPRHFVGQVSDGLAALIEQWEYTADYLEFGAFRDGMMIRECDDAEEARWIAVYYKMIRERILAQLPAVSSRSLSGE